MTKRIDSCRILIVDDEPENILPLIKHLETDFEIVCATDGEQALEIARSDKKPDLILLDILMPGMDGYAVFSQLKIDDATGHIPVVFLTAKRDAIDETRGLDMGASDYIIKPFNLSVVRARIRNILNLKKELDRRQLLKTQLEELNAQLENLVQQKIDELQRTRQALKLFEEKYSRLFQEKPAEEMAKRILVVDDNAENVHILIQNLQAHYEIIYAANGQVALEIAFSDTPPDLILLDVVMPGMDGFEVCSRLKAKADTQEIPVIFVTALDQEVDEAKGLDLGAVDFITKPFSIPVVEARIKAALRLKEEMNRKIILTRKLESLNKELEIRIKEKASDLKQVRTELQVSEKKYQDIYENAVEGIFQTSFEGRFLSANPAMARILDYSSPEELLANLTNVKRQLYVQPEQRDVLLALLKNQIAVVGHELQFYKKDRQIVWVSISARIVRDDSGRPIYLEGFITDISERKRLEDQLRQAAKMEAIGNLVSGVAHDFNNLMTAVIGFSDLLLMRFNEDDPFRREIDQIKKAGESASNLTQRLLAFSRKQVHQPVVLDLNAAVANIEQMLRRMIGEDIELDTRQDPVLNHVLADPGQIEQVIMNLVVNARDAMPDGGKLGIETSNVILDETYCREHIAVQPGPYVLLAVSDNGIGMDTETLSHMFEPFFTTKGRGKGTGLGLATIYGIVKQSDGHIGVYSEPGRGSTFKVYFPVSDVKAAEPIAPPKIEQSYRGTETIIVAEDNEGVRELVAAILAEWGYNVLTAETGQSCLHQITEHPGPLDLLLTDVIMPDLNGKELAQQAVDRFPGLKVLFMSGYTDNVIARHGVLEEGTHFIQKPFTMEGLAVKVRELLDSK